MNLLDLKDSVRIIQIMFRQTALIPSKEVPKLSSYRQKRAQSKHSTTHNTDNKGLQQIEQTIKSNMKRRGLSQQSFPTSNGLSGHLNEEQTMAVLSEQPSMKIIEKYGTVGNNIAEVNEEELGASITNISKNDETIKKQPRKKLNLGKALEKDTFHAGSQRNLKTEPSRGQINTNIPRKTLTKVLKPATAKVEKKLSMKILHGTQHPKNDGLKFIKKVELLQQEISKGVSAEKMNQLKRLFDNIIEVLKIPQE